MAVPGPIRPRSKFRCLDDKLQHDAADRAPQRFAAETLGLRRGKDRAPDRRPFLAPRPRSHPLPGPHLRRHPQRRRRLHEGALQLRGRGPGLRRLATGAGGHRRRGGPEVHRRPAVRQFPLLPAGARDERSRNRFRGRGRGFHAAAYPARPYALPLLRYGHERHGFLESRVRRGPLPDAHLRRDAQRKHLHARRLRFLVAQQDRHDAHVHRAVAYRHQPRFRSGSGAELRRRSGPGRSGRAAGPASASGYAALRLRFVGDALLGHPFLGRGRARKPLPDAHLRRDAQRKRLHARRLRFLVAQPYRHDAHVHRAQPDDQLHAPGAGVQRFGHERGGRGRDTDVPRPPRRRIPPSPLRRSSPRTRRLRFR